MPRLIVGAIGADMNAPTGGGVAAHRFVGVNHGAVIASPIGVGADAALGGKKPRVGLKHRHQVVGGAPPGNATGQRRGIEHLVRQVVFAATTPRALKHHTPLGAHIEPTRDVEQRLGEPLLQLTPQGKGATQQGDVRRILEIGQPDNAREAMRRAEAVAEVMLLQRQHAKASGGHVVRGGTPHTPNAGDDYVIGRGHARSVWWRRGREPAVSFTRGRWRTRGPSVPRPGRSVVPAFPSG